MIRSIDIWVEREKDSVVVEKINISKKQPELNERRRNYALKIIISGYFAFFLELTFYFLLYILYIYTYLLSARLFQVRTCVPSLQVATPLGKKGYTFRGITFVPLLPERPKFSVPFVRDYQFRASSWVKAKFNGTTQSHSCFWFKNEVSAPFVGKCSHCWRTMSYLQRYSCPKLYCKSETYGEKRKSRLKVCENKNRWSSDFKEIWNVKIV